MRGTISTLVLALTLACGAALVSGCAGDDTNGAGGAGGGGGAGGSGAVIADAASEPTGTVGCIMKDQAPMNCPNPPVTYSMVQPILQMRCVNVCHSGTTPDPSNGMP